MPPLEESVGDAVRGAALSALSPFAPNALIAEDQRLLQLRTALPALWLVPDVLQLHEALGEPFEFMLDVLSTSAAVDIQALVGEQISIRLRQPDASYRAWHGYVLAAAQAGSDGGLARYRLTGRPWLSLLGARVNSHVHAGQTALQTVEAIFAEYPQANWRIDVAPTTLSALRVRPLAIQLNESDEAFCRRLLAEEGLLFHFEQLDGQAAQAADQAGHARHVMVITDGAAQPLELGTLRYTQPRPDRLQPAPTDALTQLSLQAQAPLAGAAIGHWDAQALHGRAGEAGSAAQPQHYDGSARAHADAAQAQREAEQVLAASELASQRWHGVGTARHLCAGARLSVTGHPLAPAIALRLLTVDHHARNDLGQIGLGASASPGPGPGQYLMQFEAAPAELALVPAVPERPRAPMMLTARVVGYEQRRLTTDRDLRVKVQFDFQRGERPHRGGAAYRPAVGEPAAQWIGHAPGDERSGAWLRMLVPVAGADWGWVLPPRIGSQVLVYFADADIDQPVIGGALHAGDQPPPFAAGIDSGVNHPGTISGLRSQALDGQDGSQWLHDDATGQLRLRLHSAGNLASAGSELALGHLIQQASHSAQRGAWRGAGFEALTPGWAVVRAGQGLLLSTQARAGTYGSAQGSQMDAAEALARLNAARTLGQSLGAAAAALGAQGLRSHADAQAVHTLTRAIDPAQDGHHATTVNGQDASVPGDGRAAPGQPVPAFAEPLIALDSASSLLLASGASTQLYAGQSLSLVAQGDLHHAAAHTYAQVSGQGASLYTHQGGITAHAANGPVSVRAHTDTLHLLAQQGIQISSVNDEIRLFAKDTLTLGAADSSIVLDGPDITVTTPGSYQQMGGNHAMVPGGSAAAALPALPRGLATEAPREIELNYHYDDLQPVAAAPYKVTFEDGTVLQGALDAKGYALLSGVPAAGYTVEFGESAEAWQAPPLPPDDAAFAQPAVQAEGRRAIEDMLDREPVEARA
jgi:type VI secretion system secreted protein VgrG